MAASMRHKRAKKNTGKVINFDEIGVWKRVDLDPNVFGEGEFSGFSGLEELTNFDVKAVYGGKKKHEKKKKKRKPVSKQPPKKEKKKLSSGQVTRISSTVAKTKRRSGREICREILQRRKARKVLGKKKELDMSAWDDLPVPSAVFTALRELGFTKPTPIQANCLKPAIEDKSDVVGGAETGSGKTLAFGIPLIHMYLNRRRGKSSKDSIEQLQKQTDRTGVPVKQPAECNSDISSEDANDRPESKDSEKSSLNLDVKHLRDKEMESLLDDEYNPEDVMDDEKDDAQKGLMALVLTPTRELAVQIKNHIMAAAKYTDIKVAVVVGGMSMEKQLRVLKRRPDVVIGTPGRIWELYQQEEVHLLTLPKIRCLVIDEADRMVEKKHFQELTEILGLLNSSPMRTKRQTLVFSATLSLVHHGPLRKLLNWKERSQSQVLGNLMERIGIKRDAKVVDLTQKEGTVASLLESKIFCTIEQKDLYLYYFLLQYPGRTLVFCNSIDCIRRLASILTILQRAPFPLHSSMHQKQRLKNLERFTENPNGLLLATDVASRGLDIPNVQHVIHYQVPRTTEIYIHRSGRTARQEKQGLSLLLLSAKEIPYYRRVCKTLDKEEIVNFPVDHQYLREVTDRVKLAREIDSMTHQYEKKKHKNEWFQQAAKEMDLILEEDQVLDDLGTSHDQKMRKVKLSTLKTQLKFLLKRKIFPSGHSQLYITSSGTLLSPMQQGNLKDKETALAKLNMDKQFRKNQKKGEQWKKRKREMAEDAGLEPEEKAKKKRIRNKYHYLGRKDDQQKSSEG